MTERKSKLSSERRAGSSRVLDKIIALLPSDPERARTELESIREQLLAGVSAKDVLEIHARRGLSPQDDFRNLMIAGTVLFMKHQRREDSGKARTKYWATKRLSEMLTEWDDPEYALRLKEDEEMSQMEREIHLEWVAQCRDWPRDQKELVKIFDKHWLRALRAQVVFKSRKGPDGEVEWVWLPVDRLGVGK